MWCWCIVSQQARILRVVYFWFCNSENIIIIQCKQKCKINLHFAEKNDNSCKSSGIRDLSNLFDRTVVVHACRVGVGFHWISQTLFSQSTRLMNAALAHTYPWKYTRYRFPYNQSKHVDFQNNTDPSIGTFFLPRSRE